LKVNYKLYFKCLFSGLNFSFLKNLSQNDKNYNILLEPSSLYFLNVHFRFSTLFYCTQLVDIFSYEIPSMVVNMEVSSRNIADTNLSVYNYHSLLTQDRFFVFVYSGFGSDSNYLPSVAELYSASNWLERELSELSGINVSGKKDLRNLMLQYGDSSSPFKKSFPTIGLKEMFYNPVKDTIVQNPVTLQL